MKETTELSSCHSVFLHFEITKVFVYEIVICCPKFILDPVSDMLDTTQSEIGQFQVVTSIAKITVNFV